MVRMVTVPVIRVSIQFRTSRMLNFLLLVFSKLTKSIHTEIRSVGCNGLIGQIKIGFNGIYDGNDLCNEDNQKTRYIACFPSSYLHNKVYR